MCVWDALLLQMMSQPPWDEKLAPLYACNNQQAAQRGHVCAHPSNRRMQMMSQPPWDEKMEPYYILHYTYGMDYTLAGEFTPGG